MTKTQELIEEAARKLGGVTDYKLAQALKLPRQRISDFRAGSRQADSYAAAQIALALDRDPLEVIAEIEAESARSKPARDFWRSFLSGHHVMAIGGGLLLMFSFFEGVSVGNPPTRTILRNQLICRMNIRHYPVNYLTVDLRQFPALRLTL